ncbi:MAG: hypothetical protein AAGL17_04085 [Cyanobacteria bacterium J06576_12]
MQADITKQNKGELIQRMNEAGYSHDEIAGALESRDTLIEEQAVFESLQKTLNDPTVQRAAKIAGEQAKRENRIRMAKRAWSLFICVLFAGVLLWALFGRQLVG